MRIAVPKENYPLERRVSILPEEVLEIVKAKHDVFVQTNAGNDIGISDDEYVNSGAKLVSEISDLYKLSELIVKLKAPVNEEFSLMNDKILLSMIHSEQNPDRIYYAGLNNIVMIEMEKIKNKTGKRVIDQTQITGEVGVIYALRHSDKIPQDMKAVILGYGNVSSGAISVCSKLGINYKIIRKKEFKFLMDYLNEADLLINGISWPKEKRENAQYLLTRDEIRQLPKGKIILDLAVDFPSPIETIRPTTYSNPYYIDEGHTHISIYGYPGLVPITSSKIYSKQITPIVLAIADNNGLAGIEKSCDMGKSIKDAVLDPAKTNWENYTPEKPKGSNIE